MVAFAASDPIEVMFTVCLPIDVLPRVTTSPTVRLLIIAVTAALEAAFAPVTAIVSVLEPTLTEIPAFAVIVDSKAEEESQTDTFIELPIKPGYLAAYSVSESAVEAGW